ncbi:MAG: D-(-)-3-hydroxybutyrate oligomer hydrolase [Rhodocyclaceae bacterium]|nr:D-(-)-3-hydroxybutyrate oligomer hydrolase [Rhodocyclaceae bacterium]
MQKHARRFGAIALALSAGLALTGFSSESHYNTKPRWLGDVIVSEHRSGDDLLTAGLGASGLAVATTPALANPAAPTPTELRRLAIHANYRALIDTTANGGYRRLYGPNLDVDGHDTLGEGLVPGTEFLAFARNLDGVRNVTLLVQLPDSFDASRPCIVAAPSSGSRGVYGAIGTTGEWALKHGCAVAYTDKGTGAGAHELETNTITLIDGTLADADAAGRDAYFSSGLSADERAAYLADHPNRYAMKHAHSGDNPERIWGLSTIHAIEFAFYVLNEQFGTPGRNGKIPKVFTPGNTIVIAASVSNGGGAVLAAAEQAPRGLIDAVVAGEPQINLKRTNRIQVFRGSTQIAEPGRPLYDYVTYANLIQGCAAIAPSNAASPFGFTVSPALAANRCASLAGAGLVSGATTTEQAEDAKARLVAYGWEPESALLHASHFGLAVSSAVSVTYANAYSRAGVRDDLCGFSMGTTSATTGLPTPPAASPMPTIWGLSNGIPPSTGVNLIAENSLTGPIVETLAVSASTGLADYNFDGAMCLRGLLDDRSVQRGIDAVSVRGDLNRTPTVIVHGRSDALIPVNHTSRAYLAANSRIEGHHSELSYIEVTNGQHFDAFVGFPGFDALFVPLHFYGGQALDMVWKHLTEGAALPASQVVRTTPRGVSGGVVPALTRANLPDIQATPAAGDAISAERGMVVVPD